jgi:protein SCO1/2
VRPPIRRLPRLPLLAVPVLATLGLALPVRAEDPPCDHCPKPGASGAAAPGETRVEVPDVTLVDQDGARVPLRAALAGDRLVVVDFVFTTCTTVCPVLSALLARVQEGLGPRAGRDVLLVSVSLDPARDTPERLKAFARRFGAGPGWTWLTGERGDVERALRGLGASTANVADHAPMVLVGDGRAGLWTRMNGFPRQDRILARVDELLARRAKLAARD